VKAAAEHRPRAALTVASLALFTDALLYGLAVPVLPLLASDQGASTVGVGLLFAAYAAALVAFTPVAGLAVDRFGTRSTMLAGLGALAAATLLLVVVEAPALLVAARALQGAAAAVTWTASLALIAETHPPETRGPAMGIALSAVGVGVLAGPPLGGALADWLGPHAPFLLGAAVAIADAIARLTLLPAAQQPALAERVPTLRRRPDLLRIAALTALGAAVIAFLEPILPLHARSTLGLQRTTIGLLFGAGALAAAAGPPLVGLAQRTIAARRLAAAGAAFAAAGLAATALLENPWLLAAAMAVIGMGAAALLTPTLTMIADIAERDRPPAYGTLYALYNLAYATGLAAAPLLAGLLDQATDFTTATLVAAVVAALAAAALLRPPGETTSPRRV